MSSWLSGGISSLTDQISTFTKEVISESTQEIEDPVTELHLAKKRIEEVEKQNAQYVEELKRCHDRMKELEERAETSELQVVNNNHQYRKLIQEKDDELKQLRLKYSEVQEQQKMLVFNSEVGTGSNDPLDVGVSMGGEFASDSIDYEEMMGYSHVNQLQTEVARLQVECQHWKHLARSKSQQNFNDIPVEDSTEQLQELQHRLEEERQRHEHELTSLQILHAQQLEAISVRQTGQDLKVTSSDGDEQVFVSKLKESQSIVNELNTFISDMKSQLKRFHDNQATHFESEKTTLMSYLEDMQESLSSHREKMADLQSQRTSLESETTQLNTQVELLQRELTAKESEIDQLRYAEFEHNKVGVACSNDELTVKKLYEDIDNLKREMVSDRSSLEELVKEEQKRRKEIERTLEKGNIDHKREMEHVQMEKDKLEQTVTCLEDQVERKGKEIADNVTLHREELSQLKQQLQNELDGKDKMAENIVRENGQRIVVLESDCKLLREKLMKSEDSFREMEGKLKTERESLLAKIDTQKREMEVLEIKLCSINKERDTLQVKCDQNEEKKKKEATTITDHVTNSQQLDILNTELQTLRIEKDKMASELERELKQCDELTKKLTKTTAEIERQRKEIIQLKEKVEGNDQEQLSKVKEDNQLLSSEKDKYRKELDRLRSHLIHIEEERTQEQLQADHMQEQLRSRLRALEESVNNQDNSSVVAQLRSDVDQVASERNAVLNELSSLKVQHHEDSIALQNLQAVLEDFQQGHSNNTEVSLSLTRSRQELDQLHTTYESLLHEHNQTKTLLHETSTNASSTLSELERSKEENRKLTSELNVYQAALHKSKNKIEQLSQFEDGKVDRSLVRNLFMTFLSSQDKKREEIATLIGKILEVPPEQLDQFFPRRTKWLPEVWSPSPASTPPGQETSFSKLFVSFLEAESKPTKLLVKAPPHIMKLEAPPKSHPSPTIPGP